MLYEKLGEDMPNLNVKDFPENVKEKLNKEAEENRRSLSAQLIYLLEERYDLLSKPEERASEAATV
jgi:hypothetical protein